MGPATLAGAGLRVSGSGAPPGYTMLYYNMLCYIMLYYTIL